MKLNALLVHTVLLLVMMQFQIVLIAQVVITVTKEVLQHLQINASLVTTVQKDPMTHQLKSAPQVLNAHLAQLHPQNVLQVLGK
jgi:hypothetical protein